MENKKNLQVNTAMCDVRNITEAVLAAYEEIRINTATIVTSPAAQELLGKYEVQVNCASSINLDSNVRFTTVNGPMTIRAGQAVPEERSYLVVNAPLTIEPGTEEILKSYAGMTINGPVTCPESLTGLLAGFQVNGPIRTYPDGGILLKKVTVLDRMFHLRAKRDACYCAPKKLIALAPDIAFDKLAEKNVCFVTKELLVSESHAEAAVALVDERADITVLPDGCAYVDDDAVLDENLVKRYGGKLYITGNLSVTSDSAAVLDQVSYLRVGGDLWVCRNLRDRMLGMDAAYGKLRMTGGLLIYNRPALELTAGLLSDAEGGVSVMNCANVTIAPDVTPELLKGQLVSIANAIVFCASKEQMDIVQALAEDCAVSLLVEGDEAEADEEPWDDDGTVQINAATYTF